MWPATGPAPAAGGAAGLVVLIQKRGVPTGYLEAQSLKRTRGFPTRTGGTLSGNTATSNGDEGFLVGGFGEGFSLSNTATFELNEATDNSQGYDITGTPASGSGTNTGSGNGSNDSY